MEMDLDQVKSLWQENEVRVDKASRIDPVTLELIMKQKAKSALMPLYRRQIVELIFHSLAIILLCIFCFYNYNQWKYALSAYMLIIFYSITFNNCISQLLAISNLDPKNKTVEIQISLAKIETSRLKYLRLSVLLIPALLSFPVVVSKVMLDFHISFWKFDIIQQSHGKYWIVQIITFAVFIPLGLWFRSKISYRNIHEHWVKSVIQRGVGKGVRKALENLHELERLQKDGEL